MIQGSSLFAASSYLGTNREDIESGLRIYTQKELEKERSKEREEKSKHLEQPVEAPSSDSQRSWDEDIKQMVQSEPVPQSPPMEPMMIPPIEVPMEVSKAASTTPDWQASGFGKAEKTVPEMIVIPTGSYVIAQLLTGIDAPTKSSIPTLLKLRLGFVSPNQGFVDLSGCHAVAQATGDLSTERIRLKTTSLSCLSPEGVVYEEDMNSFAAGRDGIFGVPGDLHSRQGRVAVTAFLNAIVEGAAKLISNPPGSKSEESLNPLTMTTQGSSSAAAEVVRWYLEEAKGLMPTVEAKAGSELSLILLSKLKIPKAFFKNYQHNGVLNDENDLVL
jgi:conjugal transfer pilus assembly protein TraB